MKNGSTGLRIPAAIITLVLGWYVITLSLADVHNYLLRAKKITFEWHKSTVSGSDAKVGLHILSLVEVFTRD